MSNAVLEKGLEADTVLGMVGVLGVTMVATVTDITMVIMADTDLMGGAILIGGAIPIGGVILTDGITTTGGIILITLMVPTTILILMKTIEGRRCLQKGILPLRNQGSNLLIGNFVRTRRVIPLTCKTAQRVG